MNKPLSLLSKILLSCMLSASAFAGDFPGSTSNSTGNDGVTDAQVDALTQRIEKLSRLHQGRVVGGAAYEMSESQDSFDAGLVHFDDETGVLFETLPDTTFEVALLRHRPHLPEGTLILGGYLKVAAQYWGGDSVAYPNTQGVKTTLDHGGSGVYWLATMLDVYGSPNEWVSGFASLKATNSATDNDRTDQGLTLSKAFVSIGNLEKNPLFLLVGKTHLPFGVFAGGGPMSPSVTRSLFKAQTTNQIWLGFDNRSFNSNLSVFESYTDKRLSNFVLSFFLTKKPYDLFEYTFGMGYLNDARGTDSALGKAYKNTYRVTSNRLALYDFNAAVSYGPVALRAEIVRSFRPIYVGLATAEGLTTAGQRLGRPESWYFSGDYSTLLLDKPTIFSLGYSVARHSEGVMQPIVSDVGGDLSSYYGLKDVWVGSATRELGHNFYVALELQRAKSYMKEVTNTVSLDLNYYF